MSLTVRVFKLDGRTRNGERLVTEIDHSVSDRSAVNSFYTARYPADKGYRFEIFDTFVVRRNSLTGQEYQERWDTPLACSPSSEAYWSR